MSADIQRGAEAVARAIEDLLEREDLAGLVAAYFDPASDFAADTYNTLGDNDPYRITADDLLAVSLLDTPYPPGAIRGLLGADQGYVANALHSIDPAIDLWDSGSGPAQRAAAELWSWLKEYRYVGPTRAGKLLARKRPRLIPIVDKVVTKALPAEANRYWAGIAEALRNHEDLVRRIEGLRPQRLSQEIPTLRLLDVAIWMAGSGSSAARVVAERTHAAESEARRDD